MTMQPVFDSKEFYFPGLVPDHIDAKPSVEPFYPQGYTVFSGVDHGHYETIASNIPCLDAAMQIAHARLDFEAISLLNKGYSNDVGVASLNGVEAHYLGVCEDEFLWR